MPKGFRHDAINKEGELADYRWVHSTKADLYRRLGRIPAALEAHGKALEMSQLEPEKRLLQRRIRESKNNSYRLSIWARPKRL
jgi:RNA polymerase sigma-70 factor, ECF subfamily